ncbi:response regulator [Mangrovibrevibacter kandeliae]|uniref:response regulator n=1 Tax=Mangrovibrevibacter kandeliae TaxID=2968473 RepID=UPI0021187C2A|nr:MULTISPECIES: response regulator [unclassified Aurantimonas]MCQ8784179.1 response regulator [Aurantimonas sp. CSK15Z-1]MCQ8784260.1 response regulator [Aurantimonas sp. CSK15Z-1]MCW4116897.1 response regulator [Aurantimonas sp. MSK8Z-1]
MQSCLIVDGSEVICKVAGRILFESGYGVSTAHSAKEAVAAIESQGMPGILIVSAILEERPCEDLIRAVRAMPSGQYPAILGAIVEANLGVMTRLKRAGATGFIYKPFDRRLLLGWLAPYASKAA